MNADENDGENCVCFVVVVRNGNRMAVASKSMWCCNACAHCQCAANFFRQMNERRTYIAFDKCSHRREHWLQTSAWMCQFSIFCRPIVCMCAQSANSKMVQSDRCQEEPHRSLLCVQVYRPFAIEATISDSILLIEWHCLLMRFSFLLAKRCTDAGDNCTRLWLRVVQHHIDNGIPNQFRFMCNEYIQANDTGNQNTKKAMIQ